METSIALSIESFDTFASHPWVTTLSHKYQRDSALPTQAIGHILKDLNVMNQSYIENHGKVAFTDVQGRIKGRDSFMQKLYKKCCAKAKTHGITQDIIQELYSEITDICGIRFSCPYFDQVNPTINNLIRPRLTELGYATDLQSDPRTSDKDYLDNGDKHGYRSYHFFVKIPTRIDIYGNYDLCLCEVQARTELQHVWAAKSHDLLYKPKTGWEFSDPHVVEDMRQVSNSLRAADQFLVSIRDRVRGGRGNVP